MGAWDDVVGQDDAVELLRRAAGGGGEGTAMTHAWLISGPPGSGRSNIAYAFAAELLGGGSREVLAQVAARSHPDLAVLRTERVIITIDEVRHLVSSAQFSPAVAPYRVLVIEDADRMSERTSNLLLKSLEEPPERTVWILCAPSEADLIPTIRSRVRSVRLRVPAVADVAALLQRRDGVDAERAAQAARHAQSHIGMARRLATDDGARDRRAETLRAALGVTSTGGAVLAAARLLEIAGEDAKHLGQQRDDAERADLLRSLGVEPGQAVPSQLRSQVRTLEDDQKRRATRALRDGVDRVLVDLLALYRDIVMLQLGSAGADALVHEELRPELERVAADGSPEATLALLERIRLTRRRLGGNVAPALALEAMLIGAVHGGER